MDIHPIKLYVPTYFILFAYWLYGALWRFVIGVYFILRCITMLCHELLVSDVESSQH